VLAAEVLVAQFEQPLVQRSEAENDKRVGCVRAALLLLGIATENALKAVVVSQGTVVVANGKVDRKSLGGGRSGHDLRVLAEGAGIKLSEYEQRLLHRLSKIILWAGRYQQPLSEAEFSEAATDNPRTITPQLDLRTVRAIIEVAAKSARAASNA
jgi:hypothetical protein